VDEPVLVIDSCLASAGVPAGPYLSGSPAAASQRVNSVIHSINQSNKVTK